MSLDRRIKNPSFLLVQPPLQYAKNELQRPDGTLALPYLDAALTEAGFRSELLDAGVGAEADRLEETFFRKIPIGNDLFRVGMSSERILEEAREFDVVGVTSIFTQQTSRCFEISEVVKKAYPEKILIAGGVNARTLRERFFDHGFDAVFLSEAEKAVVQFARFLESGTPSLSEIPGVAFRENGRTVLTPAGEPTLDLDEYPMPSWHKLPNRKYWEIGRFFGGKNGWMEPREQPKYAAMFTSRGCPFRCSYCHISNERNSEAGNIGELRFHSIHRVERELDTLKNLGVDVVFINDDTFLANKPRVLAILAKLREYEFKLADVNGVNIIHLFRRQGEKLVVDEHLLEELRAAGFRKISLPFESGSQRLLDKYSSGKWNLEKCDVMDLVRKMREIGILADGNFMIGYPDETLDELTSTFLLARRAMDAGLIGCGFYMVQPFPGSKLFDESLANGQLPKSWHWDELGWSKGSPFSNPAVDRRVLQYSWSLVWKLLNPASRVMEMTDEMGAALGSELDS